MSNIDIFPSMRQTLSLHAFNLRKIADSIEKGFSEPANLEHIRLIATDLEALASNVSKVETRLATDFGLTFVMDTERQATDS